MTQARAIDHSIDVVLFCRSAQVCTSSKPRRTSSRRSSRAGPKSDRRQEQVGRHVTTVLSTGQVALRPSGLPKVRNPCLYTAARPHADNMAVAEMTRGPDRPRCRIGEAETAVAGTGR